MNFISAPVRFGLNLYLASCLLPSDFGAMVIPAVIISLSTILVDSGFKASLIQKNTLKNSHSSTIFFVNFLVSFILFILFVAISVPLESFFEIENLSILIILTSCSLVIKSLSMVNEARMQIKGHYGQLIFIELLSYIIGYTIAILLAKKGYGPISIAVMSLIASLFYTLGLVYRERFLPRYILISRKLFFLHWRMGKSLLGQGLLEVFSEKIDEIVLSKFIGVNKLGLYSKGREYSGTLGIIGSKFFARPWFSIMSKFSSNKIFFFKRFKLAYICLVGVGLGLVVGNYFFGVLFIEKFLGSQWVSLASLFNYFIASSALYYLVVFNKYSILALGKSSINLRIEMYYNSIKILLLFLIFIFLNKSTHLIIFLVGLDIITKIIMLIIQGVFFNKILYSKTGAVINLYSLLLIVPFIISISEFNSFVFLAFSGTAMIFILGAFWRNIRE